MLDWRILAFTVPFLFATYQTLSKVLPKGTSVFLVNAYASLIGLLVMLALHLLTQSDKSINLPAKTLFLAIGIGLLISLGNYGIIKAFSLGAPQSVFSLLFYVTLIIYGIIFGVLIWKEKLQLIQLIGILLACLGLYITLRFKK